MGSLPVLQLAFHRDQSHHLTTTCLIRHRGPQHRPEGMIWAQGHTVRNLPSFSGVQENFSNSVGKPLNTEESKQCMVLF